MHGFGQILKVGGRCTKKHVPPAWFRDYDKSPYKDAEMFTFVRYPYARLISEYKYICWLEADFYDVTRGQRKTSKMKQILEKEEIGTTSACRKDMGQMNDYFDALLPAVNTDTKLAKLTDCHFVPQAEYLKGVDNQLVFCTAAELQAHIKSRFPSVDQKLLENFHDQNTYHDVVRKLRPDVLQKINTEYADDFKLCGWKMVQASELD